MSVKVDLRELAVCRDAPPPRRREWRGVASRYLLPALLLAGFAGVGGWAVREGLAVPRPVTVVPVFVSRAAAPTAGAELFQAAGWVEPRPAPVLVPAMTEGVVEEVCVTEGQDVRAGQVVARLVEADARLAVRAAEADLRLRQAEADAAQAGLDAAKATLAHPAALEAALAEAEAALARNATERAELPARLRAAEARLAAARDDHQAKHRAAASGAVSDRAARQAEADFAAAAATADEHRTRLARLGPEADALTRRRDALRRRLELKTEEKRALAEAQAAVESAAARLDQARVALDAARLRLERHVVRAPLAGRVLALSARPGTRIAVRGERSDGTTVLSLYDPGRLQVRADVRLEDVPRVRPGQPVRIEAASAAGPLAGEVLLPTSLADVQKNTLQVKVSIADPPSALRPDMLVRVTFLAPPEPSQTSPEGPARLLVPRQLVEDADGGTRVWLADRAAGVARRRTVRLGRAAGELVEVVEGLDPSDKLIAAGRDGLRDGERITVTGEDGSLGVGR